MVIMVLRKAHCFSCRHATPLLNGSSVDHRPPAGTSILRGARRWVCVRRVWWWCHKATSAAVAAAAPLSATTLVCGVVTRLSLRREAAGFTPLLAIASRPSSRLRTLATPTSSRREICTRFARCHQATGCVVTRVLCAVTSLPVCRERDA